jgi:hypothetical protein
MLNTNADSKAAAKETNNADAVKALVDVVTKAMTTDNIDDMVNCFAADSEWVTLFPPRNLGAGVEAVRLECGNPASCQLTKELQPAQRRPVA